MKVFQKTLKYIEKIINKIYSDTMQLKSIFGFLFCLLSRKFGESVPVRKPGWYQPCQTSESYGGLPPVNIPIGTAMSNLYEKASICQDTMLSVKEQYIPDKGVRITSSIVIGALEQDTSQIPALNLPQSSFENVKSNLSGILNSDYKSLSTIAVFLEKTIEDEAYFDHSAYAGHLNPANTTLYGLLCEIHTTIHTVVNSTLGEENISSRDVMSDSLRSIGENRQNRYFRDFIIIDKSLTYLRYLAEKYTYLKSRHS